MEIQTVLGLIKHFKINSTITEKVQQSRLILRTGCSTHILYSTLHQIAIYKQGIKVELVIKFNFNNFVSQSVLVLI